MINTSTKQAFLFISYGVFIGLLAGGLIWINASQPRGNPVVLATMSADQTISIYISGDIVNPGVYRLSQGSRIQDAVNSAGGFLPSADVDSVNLAALLIDSSQINIPSLSSMENTISGKVNINSATEEELEILPGIGPTAAKNIIEYRVENGEFMGIEDIQKVAGIGPATYEKIKFLITVGK